MALENAVCKESEKNSSNANDSGSKITHQTTSATTDARMPSQDLQ